jgi:two-component system NarL family sensor kinase
MQQGVFIGLILVLITTLLLTILSIFVMKIVLKHRLKAIQQKNILKEFENNQRKVLMDTKIQVQEQTFKSISSEIHDNIGQRLTLSKLQLNMVVADKTLSSLSKNMVQNSVDMITDCIAELRDLSRNLSYERIMLLGFRELIQNDLSRIQESYAIKCSFVVNGEIFFLSSETELIIYRIFQESLQNMLKHAKASEFLVQLDYGNTTLLITIQDNGIGFEQDKIELPNGLINIQQRAISIQASIDIISIENKGTTILLNIPYHEPTKN